MVAVHRMLAQRVRELQSTLAEIKQLQGLLPICSYCKKIRNDKSNWPRIESYLSDHTNVQFSRGICQDCFAVAAAEIESAGATIPD